MGIVSSDNVHNVKITVQVRRECIYPYMGIVSPYNVLNVKVTARVRRATHILMSIYGYCILT